MKLTRRLCTLLLALVTAAVLVLPAMADERGQELTVLFTHDMHSHFLPAEDASGTSYGGFTRLKTAIDRVRADHPDAILVDAGDFSMGTLFQTAFSSSAGELRIMGQLGYDATTLGNHEFDYRADQLAAMLNTAVDSGERLPAIVTANYLPPMEGEEGCTADSAAVWEAFENYGVDDYILLQRGGVWYAIMGLMGIDSHECAPMSGMVLHDAAETAQRIVDEATAYCREHFGTEPVVICLSHAGISGDKGEDYDLARAVDGIDLIVSGHTHTILHEPLKVGDTWIVSAGEYTKNLGVVTLNRSSDGDVTLTGYELVPIDDTVPEDPAIAAWTEDYKAEVEANYLSAFGMTFDQVLTENPYTFDSVSQVYATHHESTLGNLFSDAYKWAVEQATGQPVDMALTAAGVIRESIPQGDVTVSQVFNAASLGIGADGVPGYPLLAIWLTGKDLKTVLEIDASVSSLMPSARLYSSGVEYSFNTSRMLFNKVTDSALRRENGTEEIDDDKLYKVVTGLYCGQMLGAVEDTSFGLLSVTARDADGTPIDMNRLEDYIIHHPDGSEVKEWHAIASYLQSMGGEMDERYGSVDGRKVVYSSLNPVQLLKNPNKFTLIALAVILLLLVVIILIVRAVVRRLSRKASRHTRGYHGYRGKR